MQTLLVLGAGYVGAEVLRLAKIERYRTIAVTRAPRELDADLSLTADVTDKFSLAALRDRTGPIDLLVYAVAPGGPSEEDYRRVYALGSQNALLAFPEARFVLISSTRAVNSQVASALECTSSPTEDPCARLIEIGEHAVLRAAAHNIVLRTSGIYGPGRMSTACALLGAPISPDEQEVMTNRIHRDDLARIILFLAERATLGGTFIATDETPTTLGTMQTELKRIARELAFYPAEADKAIRRSRRSKSRMLLPSRLLELGFRFHFPSFREGYAALFKERVEALKGPPSPS